MDASGGATQPKPQSEGTPAGDSEDASQQRHLGGGAATNAPPPSKPIWRRTPFLVAVAVLVLLVGAGIGYAIGQGSEDTSKSNSLSTEVASLESRTSELEAAAVISTGTTEEEQENTESTAATPPPSSRLKLGHSGTVGEFGIRPTSFQRVSSGSQDVTWMARINLTNHGSKSAEPYCGGVGTLIDSEGREYDGESVISEASHPCDAIQPGLTQSVQIKFKTPLDAKPDAMSLWAEDETKEEAQTWSVP
jgi:hypothetical protein